MSNIKKYNASFILDMRGCQDTVEAMIEKLSKVIIELGGQNLQSENLGQKTFERVSNKKFSSGIYVQIAFDGESSIPEGIKSKLKLDKTINRILIESSK